MDPRDLKPGEMFIGPEEFVGSFPVRTELPTLDPKVPRENIGLKEWEKHGNCIVYVPNGGPLDVTWTLAKGGTVLIRSCEPDCGWYMSEMLKDSNGWFVMCDKTKVPIVWSSKRSCWVSTVQV